MMKEIEEWYAMALTDFGVAKHLEETYYPKPLEIICYHCQQAAEKAIKALIIYYGSEGGLPKSHDISFLLDQIDLSMCMPYKDFGRGFYTTVLEGQAWRMAQRRAKLSGGSRCYCIRNT